MAHSRHEAVGQLARLLAAYNASHNPLHVWRGFQICRRNDIPLQPWVLGYFDRGAEAICKLVNPETAKQRLPQQARRVGIALGFGIPRGKANFFEQAKRRDRNEAICRVVRGRVGEGWPLVAAYQDAAQKFQLSPSAINRIWLASQRKNAS